MKHDLQSIKSGTRTPARWCASIFSFTVGSFLLGLSLAHHPFTMAQERGAKRPIEVPAPPIAIDLRMDLYALIIGASNYTAGFEPLQGVKDDVLAVKKRLLLSGFEPANIVVIMNPDRQGIEGGFEQMKGMLKGRPHSARLLIYYAGHGALISAESDNPERNKGEGFLVPVDTPEPKFDRAGFLAKALPLTWVRTQMLEMPVHHAIMLLDNCFSGSVFATMRGSGPITPSIAHMLAIESRMILSAGSAQQTVPDKSIFRRYFEAALAGAADLDHDGYITGSELAIYLRGKVANESKGKQTPLSAKLSARVEDAELGGEFVLMSPLAGDASPRVTPVAKPQVGAMPAAQNPIVAVLVKPKPGDSFKDCKQLFCPSMVALPAGSFEFGAPADEPGRSPQDMDRTPQKVNAFSISQHEITFDIWDACFQDGGCDSWADDMGWGRGGRPVINVKWQDALDLAAWLSKKTGQKYRLPTELEWEYAARGGMTTARHWGDDIGQDRANCRDCGANWSAKSTAPVGSFLPNVFRLHDMLGNVWEWTQGCLSENGAVAKKLVSAVEPEGCTTRVIRGGAYSTAAKGVRSAARAGYPAARGGKHIGIRLVRETSE